MSLVHHHLIYQGQVGRNDLSNESEKILGEFLLQLVKEIGMQVLIPPQLKFSEQKAWTGLVGIVTSHIAFHYWTVEQYLQLDIYSCKKFDIEKATKFINNYWKISHPKILFINREPEKDFGIQNIS